MAVTLLLGCMTPFLFDSFVDGGINSFFANDDPRSWDNDKYFWKRDGWLFPMYQQHPPWPEIGVGAESQWLPIGILLNIVLATVAWTIPAILVYPRVRRWLSST